MDEESNSSAHWGWRHTHILKNEGGAGLYWGKAHLFYRSSGCGQRLASIWFVNWTGHNWAAGRSDCDLRWWGNISAMRQTKLCSHNHYWTWLQCRVQQNHSEMDSILEMGWRWVSSCSEKQTCGIFCPSSKSRGIWAGTTDICMECF